MPQPGCPAAGEHARSRPEATIARTRIAFAAGAVLGALVTALAPRSTDDGPALPSPAPATQRVPAPPAASAVPPTPPAAVKVAPAAMALSAPAAAPPACDPTCDATLAQRDLEIQLLRAQLKTFTGEPVAWPDSLPYDLTPAALPGRLEAAIAPYADAVAMDCSEYPCVAVLRAKDLAATGEDFAALLQAMEDAHEAAGLPFVSPRSSSVGDTLYLFTAYPDRQVADFPDKRFAYRADTLWREVDVRNLAAPEAP